MIYKTLAELRPNLKQGDWLIPKGKSVAIQVRFIESANMNDTYVELFEDFCKSFPRYQWDYPGKFAHLPNLEVESITSQF